MKVQCAFCSQVHDTEEDRMYWICLTTEELDELIASLHHLIYEGEVSLEDLCKKLEFFREHDK